MFHFPEETFTLAGGTLRSVQGEPRRHGAKDRGQSEKATKAEGRRIQVFAPWKYREEEGDNGLDRLYRRH